MNFRYGYLNDTDDDGGTSVWFKIMRRLGTSGSWTQVGQELALTSLDCTSHGDGTHNAYGGMDVPDASINTNTATPSSPIYYSVWAKYQKIGNDDPATNLVILKGSSIVVTEYGRR